MKLPEQHQLRRNRRRVLARIQIEQAEIDLDVAVGRLNPAQRQNALAQRAPAADRRTSSPASFSAK